jgi:hypothetical protein
VARAAPSNVGAVNKKAKDKVKDTSFKGLIAPSGNISVSGGDGPPPLVEDGEGGGGEGGGGGERTRDFGQRSKVMDPEAGMVTWTIADLSNPALVLEKVQVCLVCFAPPTRSVHPCVCDISRSLPPSVSAFLPLPCESAFRIPPERGGK